MRGISRRNHVDSEGHEHHGHGDQEHVGECGGEGVDDGDEDSGPALMEDAQVEFENVMIELDE